MAGEPWYYTNGCISWNSATPFFITLFGVATQTLWIFLIVDPLEEYESLTRNMKTNGNDHDEKKQFEMQEINSLHVNGSNSSYKSMDPKPSNNTQLLQVSLHESLEESGIDDESVQKIRSINQNRAKNSANIKKAKKLSFKSKLQYVFYTWQLFSVIVILGFDIVKFAYYTNSHSSSSWDNFICFAIIFFHSPNYLTVVLSFVQLCYMSYVYNKKNNTNNKNIIRKFFKTLSYIICSFCDEYIDPSLIKHVRNFVITLIFCVFYSIIIIVFTVPGFLIIGALIFALGNANIGLCYVIIRNTQRDLANPNISCCWCCVLFHVWFLAALCMMVIFIVSPLVAISVFGCPTLDCNDTIIVEKSWTEYRHHLFKPIEHFFLFISVMFG